MSFIIRLALAVLALQSTQQYCCQGFLLQPIQNYLLSTSSSSCTDNIVISSPSALGMGMNRKARRENQGKEQNIIGNKKKPKFIDLMTEQEGGKEVKLKLPSRAAGEGAKNMDTDHIHYVDKASQEGQQGLQKEGYMTAPGSVADAPLGEGEERPEVTRVVVDPETGMDVMMKGQKVLDLVTGRAVVLSNQGPMARMAQFSPGVPPDTRGALRFDFTTITAADIVKRFTDACLINGEIPPHPQVSNYAIDFVIANKDHLGMRLKKVLAQLKLRNQSLNKLDEARHYKKLLRHFILLENHISAPFKQILLDAEGKVGPNFGNLDVRSYCSGELYERSAAYIVLKAMVAHWEKKVRDADFYTNTPKTRDNFFNLLTTGDPRRYLTDSPIIHRLDECVKICARAQQMTAEFVNAPELFSDLPPELRFIEKALTIQGGTELRRYMIQDFCPQEGITPEGLREGMRRLYDQMMNMSMDPYGDFTMLIGRLEKAMSVGTDDAINPYDEYLLNFADTYEDNPGFFETYTFNEEPYSFVRFLDSAEEKEAEADSKEKDNILVGESIIDVDDLFSGFKNVSVANFFRFDTYFLPVVGYILVSLNIWLYAFSSFVAFQTIVIRRSLMPWESAKILNQEGKVWKPIRFLTGEPWVGLMRRDGLIGWKKKQ